MTDKAPPPAGELPDLQLPERGTPLGAVSVRVTKDADLGQLIAALQGAGAEIVAINTFPATRHEPDVTRVLDFETRGLGSAKAATILRRLPGVVRSEARATLGQIFGKRVIVIGGGASGSAWTPSPSLANGRSPTRSVPSPTCPGLTSSSWPARSWAARSRRR